MICRIWRGYTAPENGDAYEQLLREEVFVGITQREIRGFHGIELLRRTLGAEVEFVTLMWFDTIESVRSFAGDDYERAVVPPSARALLRHFEERSAHYEVRVPYVNA
ncbi:MAG: antibiotic biosynthesis monooxygenase [bacterium]